MSNLNSLCVLLSVHTWLQLFPLLLLVLTDECGIVAQISEPLATADIPAYYISTFKFDHALVSLPSPGTKPFVWILKSSILGLQINTCAPPQTLKHCHLRLICIWVWFWGCKVVTQPQTKLLLLPLTPLLANLVHSITGIFFFIKFILCNYPQK